jgi:trk system potassium uptake protein TrkA
MRKVGVIGLGRFGMALARQLAAANVQVIAVDTDRELIEDVKDDVSLAVVLDSTDEIAFRSQDLHKVDALVVAIGENFEAALLTAVLAKKFQIPQVICRASTSVHAEIFRQVGATEVIQPETETGHQLARRLANPFLEDFFDLGEGFTLIELKAPGAFHDKTLRDLNLRARYNVNLVAIRRTATVPAAGGEATEKESLAVPQPDSVIRADDTLVLIGANTDLARLPKE